MFFKVGPSCFSQVRGFLFEFFKLLHQPRKHVTHSGISAKVICVSGDQKVGDRTGLLHLLSHVHGNLVEMQAISGFYS